MKNAYKFYAKIDETSIYINYQTSELMPPICYPHGHVNDIFDFRET